MAAEKKVSIGARQRQATNNWVDNRGKREPMQRLTIEIPAAMHRRIKAACAEEGVKMADALREILAEKFEA